MYALEGRSWVIAYARVVFPQPLSPTSPTVSPRSIDRSTPSTARTQPWRILKYTRRPRTATRGTSSPPQPRIDDLVEASTEQVEAEAEERDAKARREEPPPVDEGPALGD